LAEAVVNGPGVYAQERWLSEHSKKDSVKANAAVFLVWGVWQGPQLRHGIIWSAQSDPD